MPYSNVSEELWGQMDKCVDKVMGQGHDKESAIAICHTSIVGKKSLDDAILEHIKAHKNYMEATDEPCTDIRNAAQTLSQVTWLAEAERLEDTDRAKIVQIMRDLTDFINSEIGEYEAGQDGQEVQEPGYDQAGTDDMSVNPSTSAMMSRKPPYNLAYIKSLGVSKPENLFRDVLAVKSTGRDTIKGYLTLWGNPGKLDIEGEYFTKASDFWDNILGFPRPLTWNHGQDRSILKSVDVVGQFNEFGDDDVGRFYAATLDRANKYRKAIDKLISQRVIGTSSDSAPQYVIREQTGKAVWLKQWPLFAGALTDVPCEPRMIGSVDYFKSMGVDLDSWDRTEAARGAQHRIDRELEDAMRLHDLLKIT